MAAVGGAENGLIFIADIRQNMACDDKYKSRYDYLSAHNMEYRNWIQMHTRMCGHRLSLRQKKNLLKKSKQNVFGDTHLSRADDNDRNESKFDLQFLEI